VPWSKASALWGGVCAAGIVLTHLLRATIRRSGWLELPPPALLVRVAVATLLMSILAFGITIALSEAVYGTRVTPIAQVFYVKLTPSAQMRNQFIFMLLVHAAWVTVYLALTMQRRRQLAEVRQAQLGAALRAAELRLLKSQLNPHFLFNALNGLRSLIADEPARARDAVTQLARMLRYTLASGDEDQVSLERELEMVDDYLALESMRLAERLRIERDIDPAARPVRIPSMLLQTLVENAIKHGIAQLKEGGTLRIAAHLANGELVLRVLNPRPVDSQPPGDEGVGLRNASERLRLLYGAGASLELDLARPAEAVAQVRLPA
jgi:LytS/YehU family sensor histidine kinase